MPPPPRSDATEQRPFDIDYSRMIRTLNEAHYATETSFYTAAGLRGCEERLWERHGRDARILDVGCGAGRVTRAVAELGGRITGVDINTAAIDAARQAAPRVEYVEASMTCLPMPDDFFDQVWCLRFSFNALASDDERLATIGELWRVCTPGGMVLVEAFNWHHQGCLGLVRAANLLDLLARRLHTYGSRGRSVPIPDRDILYLANKAAGAAPGFAHLTTVRELRMLAERCGLGPHAVVSSEAGLLDGHLTPVRTRHGAYSMWLVLRKPEEH
ncbi:MAG: class I SAM-dependent methyltransferase [Dactylosporangium sp.]|nr:class I SAM-dependent methyltransferase [Dactylosporangium sp.]NNJ60709.1 class I SAM-dependent methyltransferase [Dactylosporangium sp.]